MKENYSKKRHGEAMFQRDWCAKSLTKMFFALFFALILNPNLSFADGSKDLYPAGMENNTYATRATMVSSIGPGNNAQNPFPNYGDIYVYVKKGEILYVASSVMNAKYAGSIVVTSPSGKEILNKQGDDKEIGFIADRTKELAGPNYGSKKDGYNAIQLKDEITETGIYTVSFRTKSTGNTWQKPVSTIAIDFNQNDGFEIAAFDVSVGDGTQLFPGRAYCTIFNGHLGNNFESVSGGNDAEKRAKSQGWYSKMYILTDDGYIYIVDANGQNGFNFCFFANNKGVVSNPDGFSNKTLNSFQGSYGGTPTYQNLKSSNTIPLNIKDPRYADYSKFDNNNEIVDKDITHKMFFAIPDLENMPQEADIYLYDYQGKNQAKQKTWLNSGNQVELPKVTDLKIVGIENNKEGLIGPEGSYISFNASASGEVEISLVFNDNENDKLVIKRYCDQGENKFIWDGKKANGEYADGASVYMKAVIKSAEVHFPFNDVETNYYQDGSNPSMCGVKISLLKDGKEIPQEFYYRDNKGQQTAQGVGNYWLDPKYGNDYIIDNWVYIQGEPAIWKNKVYVNYVDLSVKNVVILNPCEDKYCKIRVGETIKYEITLENIYTTNGTFYDFKNNTKKTGCATYEKTLDEIKAGIDFISGIEITNITAKNGNTCNFISNTEEPNHSIAEFSLEKGGTITLTIEALVTAKAAHKTFTPNAYVLRPGDFKDLDATNFDANGIPKDPYIESYWGDFSNFEQNKHTTNNIKASDKIICVLNSNPQANPDVVEISKNYSTIEGGNVIKALLSGEQKDIDIDNDEITLSSAKFEETNIPLGKDFEILQNNKKIGTININSDGSYKFVPVANSSNNVTIQYFIKDSYIPETNSLLKSLGDNQGTSNSTLKFNFYNNVPVLNKTDYVVDFSGETFKLDWSDIDGDNLKNIIITQSDNYFSVVDNSGTIKVAVDAPTESQTIKVKLVDERNGESIEYTINIKISNSASLVATANTSFVEINNSASLTTSLKPSSLSPSYQWKKDGENISDETNSSFTATESIAGLYTYNCVATDKDLKTITSNDVKIRFYQKPEISVSDFVENGENITFTGNNTEATYSWEVSSDGGKTWTTISGETGKDLIVKAEENKLWRRVDTYTEGKVASNSEGALIYTIQPSIYQCFDWNNLNITLDATLKNANSGAEISDAQYVWKSGETTKTIKVSPNKGVNNYYVTITSPSFPNKKWGYKFVINVLNTSNTNDPIIYSEDFILNSTEKYILTQEEFKNDEVKLSGVGTYQVKKYLVKSDNSSCLLYQDNVTIKKKEPKVTIKTNPEMTYGDLLNNVVDIDTKDVDGKLYVVIDGKRYDVNESTYYAGTYNNIDVVFVPNNSDYSEIHLGPIDFKINKKVITVQISDKFEKDYDGNRTATINQPKLKIGNNEVILIATAEYDTPNASKSENDKKVTVSLNFPTGSKYDDNFEVKPNKEYYLGTINKAKLTINENIKDDNPSKTYDGTNTATLTEKYTVTINGNPVNVVPTATYNDENQGKNKTVDVLFTFTDENSYAENYEINKTLTTGTITQKEITVELSAQDKIYDGTNYLTPGSYNQKDDFVKGDKVSLNVDNWRFESSEIGAKAQVNVKIVDDIYNNYKLVTKGLTAKIIPPNTLTINAKDEPILGTVETQIDVIGGITANYPDATDGGKYVFYVDDKEVNSGEKISEGIHTIKVEYYNEKGIKITDATKTITVKKVDIDFTCPESATYATTEAIIGGGITANPKTNVTDAEIHYFIGDKEYKEGDRIPSGNQTIIVKYVLDNKVIGETEKSINVEKAKYYADKIENADKVYDGTKNVNDNFSISSTKNYSDKLTYVIETKEYTSENAGNQNIIVKGHLEGDNSEHYEVVADNYCGNISKKTITINIDDIKGDFTKVYDGDNDANDQLTTKSLIVDNVVCDIYATYNSANVDEANTVSFIAKATDNYDVKVNGTKKGSITPKPISIIDLVGNKDKNYDETKNTLITNVTTDNSDPNVSIQFNGAIYENEMVGENIKIIVDVELNGSNAKNYELVNKDKFYGKISKTELNVIVSVPTDKEYQNPDIKPTTNTKEGKTVDYIYELEDVKTGKKTPYQIGDEIPAGEWIIIATINEPYYFGTNSSNKFIVNKKKIEFVKCDPITKIYDGNKTAKINNLVTSIPSIDVEFTATYNTKDVKTANSVTITGIVTGDNAKNYDFVAKNNVPASITPKEIIITNLVSSPKEWDGNDIAIVDFGFTGVIDNEDVKVEVDGTPKFDNADKGEHIVTVDFKLVGKSEVISNYYLTTPQTCSGVITGKVIDLSENFTDKITKVYDGTKSVDEIEGKTFEYNGVSLTAHAEYDTKDVDDNKTIVITFTSSKPTEVTAKNIKITNCEITPKVITVENVVANNKLYDGNSEATIQEGFVSIGILESDKENVQVKVSTAKFDNEKVENNKNVTVEFLLTGTEAKNYIVSNVLAKANITSEIQVVVDPINDGVYGDVIVTPATNKEGVIVEYKYQIVDPQGNVVIDNYNPKKPIPAGTWSIVVTVDNPIYTGSKTVGPFVVSPKLITIENIVANDKIYDGNVDATIDPKYIVNGIIIGDDVVVSVSSAKFDNPEVGNNKQVTVEFSLSGNDKANYSINDKKLQANINPAIDVVFTINDDEFEYGSKIGEEISAKITDKNGNVLTDGDVEYFIVDNDGNKLPISDGTILRPNDYQIVVKYTDDTKGVLEYSEPITITVSPKVITATSEVKSSKPYDGNKSADASNAKINQKQVLDGDDVKIAIKTSEYETEKIGKQSIIVEYVLTGEDAECYVVKPSKFDGEIYSSNIKVVPNPDGNMVYTTKVDEDEVVAGFCPDTDVDVKAIVEGNPDECLIDFDENAVSQGLVNTGWININNSTFNIPANAKAGKYTGYITYRKGDVQSEKYSFAFEIYLGTEYADSKFHDVVFVNNNIDGYNFVEFQWYFGQEENNLEIVQNETKQFYQDKRGENRGLDGWYSAQVTTDDNRTLMTCPFYRSNIEILDAIKIVVAPNPIKNMEEFRVIITSANPEKLKTATLSITTASGSVVKETNKVERTNFFRLKTGEYAVQVIIDGIPYSEKFIVR